MESIRGAFAIMQEDDIYRVISVKNLLHVKDAYFSYKMHGKPPKVCQVVSFHGKFAYTLIFFINLSYCILCHNV